MIKKIVLYFFIFVLSLLVSLVSLMPASFLWENFLSSQVNTRQIGLDVQKVTGTIWEGEVLLDYKGLSSILSWDLQLTKLLMLNLPVHLALNSHAGEVNARANFTLSSVELEVIKAQVELKPLTPLFKAQRVSLDGELFVKNLVVVLEDKRIVQANGMASWSGGNIAYPAGREVHERTLPMFKAHVQTKEKGEVYLGIRDSQASFDVIDVSISHDGVGMVKITRRLLDLSNEPWSLNSREQDVVFKVKKTLY